jgi:hypothetical protein
MSTYAHLHMHMDEDDNVAHATLALENDVAPLDDIATLEENYYPMQMRVKFLKCFHLA